MSFIFDLPTILYWYLNITLIGWIFLPLTSRLFRGFFDRGYIFSKILGILLSSYGLWLLASFKILPFFRESIFIILIFFLIVNIALIKYLCNRQAAAGRLCRYYYRIFIFEEVLFLGALLFWAWVRGHEPSIHGLEKFMDFGFINSILNSSYFPPQDMWLAPANDPRYTGGFFINYYYFGHYVTAFLTKLTNIPSEITYNLMLATLFSLTFTGAFSIGANLISQYRNIAISKSRIIVGGLLTAFLVTLAGNLHTIYLFTSGYPNENPIPFWQIFKLGINTSYWYPNATRFIPNTIHEFPSYSWVVADLHGHVLDIPFVLLAIGILLALYLKTQNSKLKTATQMSKFKKIKERFKDLTFRFDICHLRFEIILLGLILAVLYMTNAWDGLIYLILASLIILAMNRFRRKAELINHQSIERNYDRTKLISQYRNIVISRSKPILYLGLVVISFIIFSLPFNLNFKPFVHGIGVVGGWEIGNALGLIKDTAPEVINLGPFLLEKGNNLRSPLWMLAILWGFFYFNVTFFIVFARVTLAKSQGLPLRKTDIFLFLLVTLSTFLLIFPEFFYAKDIYPGHYRANTMFKLGYQAFIMLAIASGYIITKLKVKSQKLKVESKVKSFKKNNFGFLTRLLTFNFGLWTLLRVIQLLMLLLISIYPYYSIQSYYGAFGARKYEGQDGLAWLKTAHPGDYEAIIWLKKNAPTLNFQLPTSVLEAVGDSYTDYARISANTGIPTPLGWPVHEWLWRGSYDEPGKRVEEVRQIYEASNRAAARALLEKYNVRYVIIGEMERQKYPQINEFLLRSLGPEIFRSSIGPTSVLELQ